MDVADRLASLREARAEGQGGLDEDIATLERDMDARRVALELIEKLRAEHVERVAPLGRLISGRGRVIRDTRGTHP